MAKKIFINYRRRINLNEAQHLRTLLAQDFGCANVFLDLKDLESGTNWLLELEKRVDACDAMLILICDNWADLQDDKGNKRLDDPIDIVRFEITRALDRKIPVIPVLVNGAEMPKITALPNDMRDLTYRQGSKLRTTDFNEDTSKIIEALRKRIAEQSGSSHLKVRALPVALLTAFAAVGWFWSVKLLMDSKQGKVFHEKFTSSRPGAAVTKQEVLRSQNKQLLADRSIQHLQSREMVLNKDFAALKETGQDEWAQSGQPTSALHNEMYDNKPFQDCIVCPSMITVPDGTFIMGSKFYEKGRRKNEGPTRMVAIHKFAAGRFEVTYSEWNACVSDGGCYGRNPSHLARGRGNSPVVNVSWIDAKAYVKWLSKKTGQKYRLLTEAEWEYVASAKRPTPFWWGDSIGVNHANFNVNYNPKDNSRGVPSIKTVPVDSFEPNPFGLYNVHGNVLEWVEDCWHKDYVKAPTDGSAWLASEGGDCLKRVIRGGSWDGGAMSLRARYRDRFHRNLRGVDLGFRVARDL